MIDVELTEDIDLQFNQFGGLVSTRDIHTTMVTALYSDKGRDNWMLEEEEGSELWTKYQSRINGNLLIELTAIGMDALEYLEKEKLCTKLQVVAKVDDSQNVMLNVSLQKDNGGIISKEYKL